MINREKSISYLWKEAIIAIRAHRRGADITAAYITRSPDKDRDGVGVILLETFIGHEKVL